MDGVGLDGNQLKLASGGGVVADRLAEHSQKNLARLSQKTDEQKGSKRPIWQRAAVESA